jgi:hypothetical protein
VVDKNPVQSGQAGNASRRALTRFSLPQSRVRQPAGPGAPDLAVDEPSRTQRDAPCAFLLRTILSAIREAALFASILTRRNDHGDWRPAGARVRAGPTTARHGIILTASEAVIRVRCLAPVPGSGSPTHDMWWAMASQATPCAYDTLPCKKCSSRQPVAISGPLGRSLPIQLSKSHHPFLLQRRPPPNPRKRSSQLQVNLASYPRRLFQSQWNPMAPLPRFGTSTTR